MKNEYPQEIEIIPHTVIPMPDGCKLAARIWRPVTAVDQPIPVILKYLPYRKKRPDIAAGCDDAAASGGAWLCGGAARPAGGGGFRGADGG